MNFGWIYLTKIYKSNLPKSYNKNCLEKILNTDEISNELKITPQL